MSELDRRIAELSPEKRALLEQLLRARQPDAPRPRPRNGGPLPCSFAQQRLWFLDRLDPGSSAYIVVAAPRLPGDTRAEIVQQALDELVRRHEVLRTTFAEVNGEPVQVIAAALSVPVRQADCRAMTRQDAEAEVRRLAALEAERPFDLARGPLLRATLVRVSGDESALLLAMHHIITDGWSMGVLYRELTTLYAAYEHGEPSPLAPLPIQYADFALWQREHLSGATLEEHVAYWRDRLAGLPRLEVPTDRPRPRTKSYRGASLPWRLPDALAQALRDLCRREGVTLFMALLAGLAALLSRYSGQTDIAIGSPIANRTRAELEGLLGFFVNTLVLRIDLSDGPSFRTLLTRVRDAALGAYAHQELPFERLVEELQPQRELGRNPLFDVLFQLQSSMVRDDAGSREDDHVPVERTSSMFDLGFDFFEAPHEIEGSLDYSTELFDRDTIERMARHYETLLAGAMAEPERPVAELPLVTAGERAQFVEWNRTAAPVPEARLEALFAAQAARTPDAPAVDALTYAELDRRANRLAHHLRARGVRPGALVAVHLERSAGLLIAILGIWKAGAAYLPLDPSTPPARIAAVLADANVPLVLHELPDLADQPDHEPEPAGSPRDLAYVIYTSGSTGTPKGVEVEHRSVVNLHSALRETVYAGLPSPLRVSLNGSVALDTSIKQIVQLLSGHCIVIVPEEVRADGRGLLRFVRSQAIDVLDTSPSQLRLLVEEGLLLAAPPSVVLAGGEAIDEGMWRMLAQSRQTAFFNLYGPTECTVDATACPVRAGQTPNIGRPLPNVETYVLDARGQLVPIGVPGELYVGGAGVARGYRGRPGLTAERFVPNPFGNGRLYRTGDRVRRRRDGALEFLGRVDDQIKVRGYRVEPAEIEAALLRHPGVADARVLLRDERLVAYLVCGNGEVAPDVLSRFLRDHLPAQMIPAAYVVLPRMPLTRGGKLDRSTLPAPDASRPAIARELVPPRTPDEQLMAAMWSRLLGVETIGVHDDFFAELGGHSLVATRVISHVRNEFGVDVPLRRIFEHPTIAGLVAVVDELRRAPAAPAHVPELRRAPRELHRATRAADGTIQLPEILRRR